MATYIEPFNLKLIVMNYFLGSQKLFIGVFIILTSYIAARYQMSNSIYAVMLTIGSILFGIYLGESMFIVILFFIGLISFKTISNIMK